MSRTEDLIRALADDFDRRQWRDTGGAALSAAQQIVSGRTADEAARHVPSSFLVVNKIDKETVRDVIADAARRVPLPTSGQAVASAPAPARGRNRSRPLSATGATFATTLRLVAAPVIAIIGTEAVVLIPTVSGSSWLTDHPNLYAIQALALVAVWLTSAAALFGRARFLFGAGAAVLGLLALLGGPP